MSRGLGGNLALHKQMLQLLSYASYADKSLVPRVEIEKDDRHRPAPVRDVWPRTIFAQRLDYRARLSEIRVPALIGVGRHDPQAPVGCIKNWRRAFQAPGSLFLSTADIIHLRKSAISSSKLWQNF